MDLEIAVTSGSQRRSSPTGFFSPAEDALKTPDGVIERTFTSIAECRVLDLSPMGSETAKAAKGIGKIAGLRGEILSGMATSPSGN